MTLATLLPHRGLLSIEGQDRVPFLQGLLTNNVEKVSPNTSIYSALLSPQGKFQYDLFVSAHQNTWFIECDRERADTLVKRLSLYKLRSDVTVENVSQQWVVGALWGPDVFEVLDLPPQLGTITALEKGWFLVDPRLVDLGFRIVLPTNHFEDFCKAKGISIVPIEEYDLHRLKRGIPDPQDIIIDRGIPLECGLDELNAIDWDKGCYMGQELTARTRYRGLVRKRLLPVRIVGKAPAYQAPIFQEDQEVGEMRTQQGDQGIAMIRLESLAKSLPFHCENATLTPYIPEWMKLPFTGEET